MNRVMRPGPLQYIYMLFLPAIPIALGIATFTYGFQVQPPDWGTRLPWAIGVTLLGLIPAAFIVGMTVRVEPDALSNVYFFGLVRERIPFTGLACKIGQSSDRYGSNITRFCFRNVGGAGFFGLY